MRIAVTLFLLLALASGSAQPGELTVATFNAWGAGANEGQSTAQVLVALEALDADIIALQEVRAESPDCTAQDCPPAGPSLVADMAEVLGYHLFEQTASNDALWANAILSRYPVVSALDQGLGVIIDVDGRRVAVLNVHLSDYPYQPYQLVGIEYGDAPMLNDEDSAIEAASQARGAAVDLLLGVVAQLPASELTVICGDFNEPSHLDWTEEAASAGRHPMAVHFPASARLMEAGFADAYRAFRADEIAFPGYTWTPLAPIDDPAEHHDRIDFVYVKGDNVRVTSAAIAGESAATSDVVVDSWPSDHRAVRVRLQF